MEYVDFIENEVFSGFGVMVDVFWVGFNVLVYDFGLENCVFL